jgi:hypothetical protein
MTNAVAPFQPVPGKGIAVEKSDAGIIWLTTTSPDGSSIVTKPLFNDDAKALAEALIGLAEVDN